MSRALPVPDNVFKARKLFGMLVNINHTIVIGRKRSAHMQNLMNKQASNGVKGLNDQFVAVFSDSLEGCTHTGLLTLLDDTIIF